MKKLLSLLSFLIISGATMPMVVAAAPCQQTNNLQTLKRNKRKNSNLEKENNEATPNSNLEKENNEATPNSNLEKEKIIKEKEQLIAARDELITKNHKLINDKDTTEEEKEKLKDRNKELEKQKNKLIRDKEQLEKDNYPKEQIDFVNNNFFYKFNINYDDETIWGPVSSGSDNLWHESVITDDWTNYAKNWEEFEKKFSEIEFHGLKAELGGQGKTVTVKEFKMPVNNIDSPVRLIRYEYDFIVAKQISEINFVLVTVGKKLVIKYNYYLKSSNAVNRTWASLKYDSIRLVGEVDLNPLLEHTKQTYTQLESFIKEKEKELEIKENDPSYNKEILEAEKKAFEEDIKWRIMMVNHNFIQDLLIIENSKKIDNIKREIEEIKERLDALEKDKSCIESIFKEGVKKGLSKSKIAEAAISIIFTAAEKGISASSNPISFLIKEFIKGFATGGLLEGIKCFSGFGL